MNTVFVICLYLALTAVAFFHLEMDNSCDLPSCTEDKRNEDRGFCPAARGSVVPGIYFDRNDYEQRIACFGLCNKAGNVGMRSEAHTWQ
jgi:hypothetical protein